MRTSQYRVMIFDDTGRLIRASSLIHISLRDAIKEALSFPDFVIQSRLLPEWSLCLTSDDGMFLED